MVIFCGCSFPFSLLDLKRTEVGNQANKLKNGLSKLIETREKVQAMSIELGDAKVKVADYQKQCDEYLVVIVQQKRDAEEQEKVKGNYSTSLYSTCTVHAYMYMVHIHNVHVHAVYVQHKIWFYSIPFSVDFHACIFSLNVCFFSKNGASII